MAMPALPKMQSVVRLHYVDQDERLAYAAQLRALAQTVPAAQASILLWMAANYEKPLANLAGVSTDETQ